MKNKIIATVVVVLGAIGGAIGVSQLALGGPPEGVNARLDQQVFAWTKASQSTSSEEFDAIAGLLIPVCASGGGFSMAVSLELAGAPVEIRVRAFTGDRPGGSQSSLQPGAVRFNPPPDGSVDTFAFTFLKRVRGNSFRDLAVEWRSVSGQPVILEKGTATIYHGAVKRGICFD